MCVNVYPITCEDPHGPVHSIDISADQHLHQEGKQLRPGLRPVPVGNGRHGVRNTGADFTDGLPQSAWQQLPDGSFSLKGDNRKCDNIQRKKSSEVKLNLCVKIHLRDRTSAGSKDVFKVESGLPAL